MQLEPQDNTSDRKTSDVRARVNRLADEVYDCFLREAGAFTDSDEWYEVAMAIPDRFMELVSESRVKIRILTAQADTPSEHETISPRE